jgi:hypothetical protein
MVSMWNFHVQKWKTKIQITKPMNEWGFIGNEILVGLEMSATINKFKQRCGLVLEERTVLSTPPHHS